jgi:hypothetical protein
LPALVERVHDWIGARWVSLDRAGITVVGTFEKKRFQMMPGSQCHPFGSGTDVA